MDAFDTARDLYRDGKQLLDDTRDAAAANDLLRWAREDLEEDLLDLKLAVIEADASELFELTINVLKMFDAIWRIIDQPPGGPKNWEQS